MVKYMSNLNIFYQLICESGECWWKAAVRITLTITARALTQNAKLTERIFWMTFEAPELARSVRAGQCLMVFTPDGAKLLGRPFEAADADPERGEYPSAICLRARGRRCSRA